MKLSDTDIIVEDCGEHRVIKVYGKHFNKGTLIPEGMNYETSYSKQLINLLLEAKGSLFLMDEISREQNPVVLQQFLEKLILPYSLLTSRHVLDFGSGCGASTIHLARLEATKVYGVEVIDSYIRAARFRAKECGVGDRVQFYHITDTRNLPFSCETFDIAVCSAVIEHIHPKHRKPILAEIWRTLKPGGYLFIRGTPNRLWPIDYHTTGLPFVPYLPLSLARSYAVLLSKRVTISMSLDDLIYNGIRGSTYWEIKNALPGARFVVHDPIEEYFSISSMPQTRLKTIMKKFFKEAYKVLDLALCQPLGIPISAFLPDLRLVISKKNGL